jgi:hypothetical protein
MTDPSHHIDRDSCACRSGNQRAINPDRGEIMSGRIRSNAP